MQSRFRRTGALVGAGAVLFGALAAVAANQADAQQQGPVAAPLDEVLGTPTQGKAALSKLQPRLAELAKRNGLAEQQLQRILATDKTSWLDKDGALFYREPVASTAEQAATASPQWATQAVTAAVGPAFELHSKPGSKRVIYLDFDGHTITGTAWNANGRPATVNITPYDTDGNPDVWSTAEQNVVKDVWARVADDYAPFDVDVTTQAPAAAAIDRSSATDDQYGTRVLIDPTASFQTDCGCGGLAYVGTYDRTSFHAYYQPALVFTKGVGTGAKNLAEVASHEAGHNLGLNHDGTATAGYYQGHGSWAPIMGVGYYRAITQWSKGEYTGANNTEDDVAILAQHGLGIQVDDHGNAIADATALPLGTTAKGVYSKDSDVDSFRIDLAAGTFTFAATSGGDLDVKLHLTNSAGTVIATADPASGQTSASTATGLSASITKAVTAGRYYVRVYNTGYGAALNTGYSTYGSVGGYTVKVTAG